MKFTQVTIPTWANAEQTAIDCIVTFDGIGDSPFTASQADPHGHGKEIFTRAASGGFGTVSEYVAPPAPTPDRKAAINKELAQIDRDTARATRAAVLALAKGQAVKTGDLQKLDANEAQAELLRAELASL